jgi:hypothetical protein
MLTPLCRYCCALHLDFGDATSKKKRSHIQLKHIALAIIYALKRGVYKKVWYNRRTQLVYMLESDALLEPQDSCCEELQFVPSHLYLMRRMPPEDKLQCLEFSQIEGAGQVATTVVDTYRWIARCFESLLTLSPALSIQRVREYQLAHNWTWCDEDNQANFGRVGN